MCLCSSDIRYRDIFWTNGLATPCRYIKMFVNHSQNILYSLNKYVPLNQKTTGREQGPNRTLYPTEASTQLCYRDHAAAGLCCHEFWDKRAWAPECQMEWAQGVIVQNMLRYRTLQRGGQKTRDEGQGTSWEASASKGVGPGSDCQRNHAARGLCSHKYGEKGWETRVPIMGTRDMADKGQWIMGNVGSQIAKCSGPGSDCKV